MTDELALGNHSGNTVEKAPFEELLPREKKILRRIPYVKFYGMREDGFYTIHIVDGYMDKAKSIIKKHIPGYRFNFVPWRKEERIQLLGCTGTPLHIREKHNPTPEFIFSQYGTLGGLASNTIDQNVYALTASHVVTATRNPSLRQEFITWSKEDQSDMCPIGREVPYQIPLILDPNDPLDSIVLSGDDDYDDGDDDEEPQYDIALIQISDQHQDIKQQCEPCSKCCTRKPKIKELFEAKVTKLGSIPSNTNGKIVSLASGGEIETDNKRAWCPNLVVIRSETDDATFSEPGDSGTIVQIQNGSTPGDHSPSCYMIFAGWGVESSYNTWGCPVSLAFNLNDALDELKKQSGDKKEFKLSCCKSTNQEAIANQIKNNNSINQKNVKEYGKQPKTHEEIDQSLVKSIETCKISYRSLTSRMNGKIHPNTSDL
ncbi:unnamed protein product [Owenia fusiformis]|uniref:Uncharacterized protein n=1 Tax=Owenia fusiformis TaxID=6347 RepID=A0A8J1UNS5_OWEFU|nr:unnamed protein product [Owenia fusiformis]